MNQQLFTLKGKENYSSWFPTIRAYLMATRVWQVASGATTYPPVGNAGVGEAHTKWDTDDQQAVGVIGLWIQPEMQHLVATTYGNNHVALSLTTLANIKTAYDEAGPTGQFHLFRQVIRWEIDERKDVPTQIMNVTNLFRRLADAGLDLPQNLRAMILCAGAPPTFDAVVTTAVHTKSAADFNTENVSKMLLDEAQRLKDGGHSLANRISGPSRQRQPYQKQNKGKGKAKQQKRERCEKCRGTGHTTAEHRDDFVPKKRKAPSAVPQQKTQKGKGKFKVHEIESHEANSSCIIDIDNDEVESSDSRTITRGLVSSMNTLDLRMQVEEEEFQMPGSSSAYQDNDVLS